MIRDHIRSLVHTDSDITTSRQVDLKYKNTQNVCSGFTACLLGYT